MKKFLGTLFLAFCLVTQVHAQAILQGEISASVNSTKIAEGEPLQLTITYKNINSPKIDKSILTKDFDILRVSEYSSIHIINGVQDKEWKLNYTLQPKSLGKLVIPAIEIDHNLKTMPITINVVPAGETVSVAAPQNASQATESQNQFSMSGRTNNNNPYVQQEIIYTLSLIDSGGLQGQEPVFELGNSKDWVIRSLGTPEINPLVVKGRNMREIVFRYAFFPQRSGKLTIPTARFEGYVIGEPQKRVDPFKDIFGDDLSATLGFTFAERQPIMLRSKPIEIDVKPIPAHNDGNWWLPAKQLLLVGKWEPENPQFKVGEAVHRVIYLKANGILNTQLPDIHFEEVKGLKQYPAKPATEMSVERGSVVSIAEVSNVYIPNQSGKMTIPALKINWFNVTSGKTETAVLPAMEIDVAANPGAGENIISEATPPSKVKNNQAPEQPAPNSNLIQTKEKFDFQNNLYIVLLLIGAFGLGIVISYFIFRNKNGNKEKAQITDYRKYIIKKAKEKDLRELRNALLEWSTQKYGATKISNFNDINKLVKDKDFAAVLDKLTAELYSDNINNWDAQTFISAFEKADKKRINKKQEMKLLPDLYK